MLPAEHDDSAPANIKLRLQELKANYYRDGNPIHAWEAIAIADRAGINPPSWSRAYVVDVAYCMLKIRDEIADGAPIKRETERVGKALSVGGRRGWLKRAAMLKRARAIYSEVCREMKAGTKLYFAHYGVARARDISPSTVRRAYEKIKKLSSNAGTQGDDKGNVCKTRNR